MPKLLKRLSRKSLKGKSKSVENLHAADSLSDLESLPPLPSRSPLSDAYPYPSPPGSPPALRVTTVMGIPPKDELSQSFAGVWKTANTAPTVSKADKVLQVIGVTVSLDFAHHPSNFSSENGIAGAQGAQASSNPLVVGATKVLEVTGGLEGLENGIKSFFEGSTFLMNALDEVAKLHPFVGGSSHRIFRHCFAHTLTLLSCCHGVQSVSFVPVKGGSADMLITRRSGRWK